MLSHLHRFSSINGYTHTLVFHYKDIYIKVYVRSLAQSDCGKNGGF